jgi:hypothetical protein
VKKPKRKPLNYFFYRGDLHKKVHIHRPNDIIVAWNCRTGTTERYVYSDVRRNGEQAFTTRQVCNFLNRGRLALERAILRGDIRQPQKGKVTTNEKGVYYYWSEDDIFDAWEYFCTVHYGRPRKDGRVTPKFLPTASELRAMIRQGTVFYVKVGDEYVPTWGAEKLGG